MASSSQSRDEAYPVGSSPTISFIKEQLPQSLHSLPDPLTAATAAYEKLPSATAAYENLPDPRKAAAAAASRLRVLADFYDVDALNVKPTLALGLPIFLLFLGAAAFLEIYVLESANAHLAIFFIGSYIVFSTYFVSDYFMKQMSHSYDAIPDDKKFYVLSNLIKSAVLLAYTPSCIYTLHRAMALDDWSSPRIRAMGVLYAIPDAVSMLLVSRMAWSTRVHHLCVIIFMLVNLFVTYEDETIGRALVVYAVFSTFAYLVNLLLASRFLPVSPKLSLTLSALALVIYAGCLGLNWAWQIRYLHKLLTREVSHLHGSMIFVYLALISLVVRDDCVLVKWLWKNVGRQWESAEEMGKAKARARLRLLQKEAEDEEDDDDAGRHKKAQ